MDRRPRHWRRTPNDLERDDEVFHDAVRVCDVLAHSEPSRSSAAKGQTAFTEFISALDLETDRTFSKARSIVLSAFETWALDPPREKVLTDACACWNFWWNAERFSTTHLAAEYKKAWKLARTTGLTAKIRRKCGA